MRGRHLVLAALLALVAAPLAAQTPEQDRATAVQWRDYWQRVIYLFDRPTAVDTLVRVDTVTVTDTVRITLPPVVIERVDTVRITEPCDCDQQPEPEPQPDPEPEPEHSQRPSRSRASGTACSPAGNHGAMWS